MFTLVDGSLSLPPIFFAGSLFEAVTVTVAFGGRTVDGGDQREY